MTKTATKTKTSKKVADPKSAKKNLDTTNKKVTVQKVTHTREVKYIYPKGCKDTVARKAFRQKTRNAIRKMEREVQKLKGEDRKAIKEELATFKSEHLV